MRRSCYVPARLARISSEPVETTSGGAARRGAFSGRLKAFSQAVDVHELGVIVTLLALCVLVRLLRLQPIEYYDDEVSRWHFVRQWSYQNDFSDAPWTHHMARFGLNVPLFFVRLLFGGGALTYYIWPVTSFALQVLFVYLIARRVHGRAAGVAGAILLSVFTGMDRGASQILPDAFSGTAMILFCYLLLRYQEATPERCLRWLIGSGLAFVWAYLIKESNLLLFPGAAAAVWLCRQRFRDGLVFSGVLFAAVALETLAFRLLTNYGSRFAIVGEGHGDIPYIEFWQLFERFTRLEPAWQMLVWMWLPAALWLAASSDRRQQALVLVPAAFLFFLTFTVRSINPTMVWVRFYSRYLEPAAPMLVVAVALFAVEAGRRAWQNHAPGRIIDLPPRLARFSVPLVAVVCCLVGLLEYASSKDYLPHHPLRETRLISAIVNDAYRRNLPIVQLRSKKREHEERKVRPLKLVYGIYLNDSALAESDLAKGGWLPNVLDGVRNGKRYAYVVRDGRLYDQGKLEAWVERGCAVVLTEAKDQPGAARGVPSLVLDQRHKLPGNCKPPPSPG
jgi:hypothetical protein